MLLGTLGASLLGDILTDKGTNGEAERFQSKMVMDLQSKTRTLTTSSFN